jgi:hypothetical protein
MAEKEETKYGWEIEKGRSREAPALLVTIS